MTADADANASLAGDGDARVRKVTLVPATPDQVEYLLQLQAATSSYDPEYFVRGRKPDEIGT
jgi:hypothetical protein